MSAVRRRASGESRVASARPKVEPAVGPDAYPALNALLSGYLHQDFVLEHQTPARAVGAFLKDASAAERRAAAGEWQRFVQATRSFTWPKMRQAFCAIGGAWLPPSRSALTTALAALGGKGDRSASR